MLLIDFSGTNGDFEIREKIQMLRFQDAEKGIPPFNSATLVGTGILIRSSKKYGDGGVHLTCDYLYPGSYDEKRYNFYKDFINKGLNQYYKLLISQGRNSFYYLEKFIQGKYSTLELLKCNTPRRGLTKLYKNLGEYESVFYMAKYKFYIDERYDEHTQNQAGVDAIYCMERTFKVLEDIYQKFNSFSNKKEYSYEDFAKYIISNFEKGNDIFSNFFFLVEGYWLKKLNFLFLYYEMEKEEMMQPKAIQQVLFPPVD